MIAIVILGLGLLTVAAMFPIAWTKARDMAEFNNQQAITASAESTVTLVANVAGPAAVLPGASSFKGDPVTGRPADPWVHPLHMANILATNPDPGTFDVAYVGDFEDAINATPPNSDFELNPEDSHTPLPWVQVEFRERLYPPMPPLPDEASLPVQQYEAELDRWYTLLSQRRFCWGAFHKLDYDPYAPVAEQPNPAEPRSFTFYFVTLRRGQAIRSPERARDFIALDEAVRSTEGPILSENMSVLVVNRKRVWAEPFGLSRWKQGGTGLALFSRSRRR